MNPTKRSYSFLAVYRFARFHRLFFAVDAQSQWLVENGLVDESSDSLLLSRTETCDAASQCDNLVFNEVVRFESCSRTICFFGQVVVDTYAGFPISQYTGNFI